MSKERRLDQILLGLGYVTETELRSALRLQRERGGRLGSHLVQAGALDPEQLAEALSLQYGVPAFHAERRRVDTDLARLVPRETVLRTLMLPVAFDPGSGVLDLVAVDPDDAAAVEAIRRIIRCAEARLSVVPEATFNGLVAETLGPAADDGAAGLSIALPDLFEERAPAPAPVDDGVDDRPCVLLVSGQVFLRNFLEPIFAREGWTLVTAADREETAAHLASGRCDRVLAAPDLAADLDGWLSRREVPAPRGDLARFASVSGALLDNPAPYAAMVASLVRALRLGIEARGGDGPGPAYELMQNDVRELAEALELPRLIADGLQLAVLLIAAAPDDAHGIDWDRTLSDARSLAFAWDVAVPLEAMRELLGERVNLAEFGASARETALAAQALAVVWHHHAGAGAAPGADPQAARSALRTKSGRLAASAVIETYLRLLERGAGDLHAAARHQVFVVGGRGPDLERFRVRLRHLGYPVVPVADLEEAEALCRRCAPSAVFVHEAVGAAELAGCRASLAGEDAPRLYALTGTVDPSRVLDLLDQGFDEVFALPRDLDLVAARLRKSLQATVEETAPAGGFGAPLSALAFTDLLQALSQSLKTVRVDLAGPAGATAVLNLDRGRLVQASCADATGAEAVYAVIAWRDEGRFTVTPVDACPEADIAAPLESILMEGCRRLDESLV